MGGQAARVEDRRQPAAAADEHGCRAVKWGVLGCFFGIFIALQAIHALGQTSYGDSWAYKTVVDSTGNIYVVGSGTKCGSTTDYDYVTIKYNSAGEQLWVASYDGPGHDCDEGEDIAVDALGNVYVTGYSMGSGTYYDYATIKYNSAGQELWARRYDAENRYDSAYALAIDDLGNVFVTGESIRSDGEDYATIKYDSNGEQLWVARYNSLAIYENHARDIVLDTSGNIYVTGASYYPGVGGDYATIKYDSAGNQVWEARYRGGVWGNNWATAIAADALGNVYVTGYSDGDSTGSDYATIKYDSAGNEIWVARYNGAENYSDLAFCLAIDASGNVYVTGASLNVDWNYDFATIKYDPFGNQAWVARYGGSANYDDTGCNLAIDATGNVYVTGQSGENYPSQDFATIKYNSAGDQVWVARYDGPEHYRDFWPNLTIDASGSVIVTGISGYANDDYLNNMATISYDSSGQERWVVRFSYCTPMNTPPGDNVIVQPMDAATGQSPVTLDFSNVVEGGETTLTTEPVVTPPPTGFKLGEPPLYYVLDTTAVFSGPVMVCFNYSGISFEDENSLRIYHYSSGSWEDITTSLDTVNDVICGQTMSFSEFAIVELDVDAEGLEEPLAALVATSQDPPLPDVAFKQGRTLPLKLQLFSASRILTDADVAPPKIVGLMRSGSAIPLEILDLDSGEANSDGSYFRYTDGYWIYNLSTKGLSTGTYKITLQLPDGDLVYSSRP